MDWAFDNDRPIYQQIVTQLERAVVGGWYRPGERLPTVRELAADAGVNPNTMQRALAELETGGLVETKRTSGRFVTENTALIRQMREEIAREQTAAFVGRMKTLGYQREEILAMIWAETENEGKETDDPMPVQSPATGIRDSG